MLLGAPREEALSTGIGAGAGCDANAVGLGVGQKARYRSILFVGGGR
jgi:hypothetical protein